MILEKVIYISYAHADEVLEKGDLKEWVTELHKSLEIRLGRLSCKHPKTWFETNLQGNVFITPGIKMVIQKTKVMVCIISPRYVKSEWCTREIDSFFKTPDLSGGISIDNRAGIFKVLKTPVEIYEHPLNIK